MINSPVRERIVLADALRGFALMGLFIVHMVEYFELYWYKPEPGWIHSTIFFIFGGKAYGLFALLFGLSFFIILDNYRQRGVDFRGRFLWRITLLLIVGYLHSLLYAGDILQLLALCGILLVLCYRLPITVIFFLCAFFLLQVPQILVIVYHTLSPSAEYTQPAFWALMGNNFAMFAKGSLPELLQYNAFEGQKGKWAFFIETGRLWNIIGLMFAGYLLGRFSFFEKQYAKGKLLAGILVAALSYFIFKTLAPHFSLLFSQKMAAWASAELFNYYMNSSIIVVELLLFVYVFQTAIGGKLLSMFAPAGKMTLTFYLLQSVIFVPCFYGFGLAWYDSIGQTWSLLIGLLFWALQMGIAIWYVNRWRYGPLEWVWRKLTFIGFSDLQGISKQK